ncbi:hypothetical protein Syun_015958 [Stephania yunnanensis]|uniref:Uncharacterized protein n=1 Tax=Stephania yunnanensis TaxID=152371 RepID=A0AAP0J412_9MAGN
MWTGQIRDRGGAQIASSQKALSMHPTFFFPKPTQRIFSASVSGKEEGRGTGGGVVGVTKVLVRRGCRLFKEGRGKRSVERDTAEGGRRRGWLGERDRRRCTRVAEKEERRIVGAPEQGAATAEALINSSGSGTWRK